MGQKDTNVIGRWILCEYVGMGGGLGVVEGSSSHKKMISNIKLALDYSHCIWTNGF